MQAIRIVIVGGEARSVEVKEPSLPRTKRRIAKLLRTMPKAMLADALGINRNQPVNSDE